MPDSPTPATPGPFARLWNRYLKARGAKFGLALVASFTILAFLAPFLAHRLPFYWHDYATGKTAWPLLREFLAPSDTTEPMLEKGINFLFLFIPAALVASFLMKRFFPAAARMESRLISLLFGALFTGAVWLSIGGMIVQGGGKDWLHYEKAPVPDVDDFLDVSVLVSPRDKEDSGNPLRATVDDALRSKAFHLRDGVLRHDGGKEMSDEEFVRLLVLRIQDAIEGPSLVPVEPFARDNAIATHGITDANLTVGINGARWNRLLFEAAYPGLLIPMRQFRSAFVTAAVASLVVLLGLTYIFMAGAYQFTLTTRWLVLFGLALVLALPFRAAPRHDHTEYRQLAAEGKGFGVFPPIPYGPNEQGFGPRLPPSWFTESPLLGEKSVRSWDRLADGLTNPPNNIAARTASKLSDALPGWRNLIGQPSGQTAITAQINRIMEAGRLYDPGTEDSYAGDIFLSPYFSHIRKGNSLTRLQQARMNRLLLEKGFPRTFAPVTAIRWKKPLHHPGTHVFGTDESGRDVLVRIIHGARVSLSVGFVSVFLATVIGLVLGSIAAYYGGRVDMLISRFVEIMMCFPAFFLILAVIAVLDKRSIINIMLVIGLTSWTGVARLIRGEMLRQKKMDYVSASVALGASDTRTIFRHILPNAMAPVLVYISFGITGAILTEASLSFIGFGVTPPTPTWGQLLSETRDSPLANWWLAVFPGIVLFLSVLAYNMVGEAMRDALDPRTSL